MCIRDRNNTSPTANKALKRPIIFPSIKITEKKTNIQSKKFSVPAEEWFQRADSGSAKTTEFIISIPSMAIPLIKSKLSILLFFIFTEIILSIMWVYNFLFFTWKWYK